MYNELDVKDVLKQHDMNAGNSLQKIMATIDVKSLEYCIVGLKQIEDTPQNLRDEATTQKLMQELNSIFVQVREIIRADQAEDVEYIEKINYARDRFNKSILPDARALLKSIDHFLTVDIEMLRNEDTHEYENLVILQQRIMQALGD